MLINQSNYQQILEACLANNICLVAVSKTKPLEQIMALYELGHRDFGENRVQELMEKYKKLPKDIRWHFIGHLQRNKVKFIAPFVHLIHAVDSFRLLEAIQNQGEKLGKSLSILLQLHIAKEEQKHGFSFTELNEILSTNKLSGFNNLQISGLMGMATYTQNQQQIKKEFKGLYTYFESIKTSTFKNSRSFQYLSIGMSGDYQIALENGSNMIRVGSLIFGNR